MAKWRKPPTTTDAPLGPKPASTGLTAEEEATAVAFRQHPLRPVAACLYARQETSPPLARSALPRSFPRQGVSPLPLREAGQSTPKKPFKDYPLGYLPVDFAQGHTAQGRQYLVVASDRPRKVAFAELPPQAKRLVAAALLRRVRQQLPYKVPTVLTDNGVPLTWQPQQVFPGGHRFDRVGREFGGEPRLTKPAPPWPNGQVERFNRTLKEATVQR